MGISALLASQILDASATGRSVITGADASAIRSTLGLGTLATQSATITDYLTIASAASTYQPLDSDLTSIAALSTTSFGRGLLTEASATTARSTLGLGTLATQSPTGTPSASTFLRGDYSWQTIDLSGYVPYTGATGAVDLGSNAFTASRATLSTGTITASSPAINVTQTWNNAATTFTGILANVTDTASNAASLLLDLQVGGASRFKVQKDGRLIGNSWGITNDAGFTRIDDGSSGTRLALLSDSQFQLQSQTWFIDRSASSIDFSTAGTRSFVFSPTSNIFQLRRTTNAQVLQVYNTFTDASNYERAKIAWESNVLRIGTEKAGTGSARALELQTDGVTRLTIASTGLATFSVKGVFTGAADCLTLVRTGLCSFSLGDANGDTFRIQNAGDSSDMLRIHGTTKLVTIYGNLDVGTRNVVTDTTTGTKIGTATTQKLGFFNATPVVQPTAVADATDAASVITQLNALLSRMRDLGLIAT